MTDKKTKIICTIGPATSGVNTIAKLISAGMDGARLNFSHGTNEVHAQYIESIRTASEQEGKIISIIQDLSGPKLRVGSIAGGETEIRSGSKLRITAHDVEGNSELISTTYPGMISDLRPGEAILIDDGRLKLSVIEVNTGEGYCDCVVIVGGILRSKKGINLPHTALSLPPLTDKDINDIRFGAANGVDFVAMSFVRSANDIRMLRHVLEENNSHVPVIAKIERPEAVANIDEVIQESDFIMVARGDMGVEISAEEVPVIQKMIIRKCNERIKPVITATQMLDTMINNPTPTRAEASDVANAILDGTDCVMLSAETSTGSYPVETVEMMSRIIAKAETIQNTKYFGDMFIEDSPENTIHTICNSAVEIATRVNAKAIITITHTGKSPLLLSNHRPVSRIISAAYDPDIIKRCKLIWGVESILIEKSKSFFKTTELIRKKLLDNKILAKKDKVVFLTPLPFSETESANSIQITQV